MTLKYNLLSSYSYITSKNHIVYIPFNKIKYSPLIFPTILWRCSKLHWKIKFSCSRNTLTLGSQRKPTLNDFQGRFHWSATCTFICECNKIQPNLNANQVVNTPETAIEKVDYIPNIFRHDWSTKCSFFRKVEHMYENSI